MITDGCVEEFYGQRVFIDVLKILRMSINEYMGLLTLIYVLMGQRFAINEFKDQLASINQVFIGQLAVKLFFIGELESQRAL